MIFSYEFFISFHLVDAAGILFYGHLFTLAHQAYEQFILKNLDIFWGDWFQNPEWFVPIGHAEADYYKPIAVGISCFIEFEVVEISRSSFTCHYRFFQNHQECGVAKTIHVFCSHATKKSLEIPSFIRLKLNQVLI